MKNGLIEDGFGTRRWYLNGNLHREDGPAIESAKGTKHWLIHGQLHRIDGPALELYNGYKEWWVNEEQIDCKNNEEFLRIIKLKAFW